jgi:hypothetical protein
MQPVDKNPPKQPPGRPELGESSDLLCAPAKRTAHHAERKKLYEREVSAEPAWRRPQNQVVEMAT